MKSIVLLVTGAAIGAVGMSLLLPDEPGRPTNRVDVGAALDAASDRFFPSTDSEGEFASTTDAAPTDFPAIEAQLFELGRLDPERALTELRAITDPSARRSAGLVLVEALGDDDGAIERIALIMPPVDQMSFRIAALARHAQRDPPQALDRALALGSSAARRLAVERIAGEWAVRDPTATLAAIAAIEDRSLRSASRASALESWARLDPTAVIAHLAANTPDEAIATLAGYEVLQALADRIPRQVLEAVDAFPPTVRDAARNMARGSLGARDPQAALVLARTMPAGSERDSLLRAAATTLARDDPGAALDWVRDLEPPSRLATVQVLITAAQLDFDRVVEFALESPSLAGYSTVASLPIEAHLDRAPALADRLMAAGESHASSLRTLLGDWGRADPEGAFDWAVLNGTDLDANTFRDLGMVMAQQDAEEAAAVLDRVPDGLRDTWIAGIATNYANQDPVAASELVLGMPRGPLRDESLGGLLSSALARARRPGAALLEAFSSAAARDLAIRDALPYIRSGNAEQAEALRAFIGDDELRAQFDRTLGFARNE